MSSLESVCEEEVGACFVCLFVFWAPVDAKPVRLSVLRSLGAHLWGERVLKCGCLEFSANRFVAQGERGHS